MAGLTPERGRGERYVLAVAGDASARRLVTIHLAELTTEPAPAALTAGLTITGTAADLALLVYGRRELADLVGRGAITLDGDAALADRFALVFPRP